MVQLRLFDRPFTAKRFRLPYTYQFLYFTTKIHHSLATFLLINLIIPLQSGSNGETFRGEVSDVHVERPERERSHSNGRRVFEVPS